MAGGEQERERDNSYWLSSDELDETGVMSFTALPREEWAEIRKRLETDPINKESLNTIDSCIALIILDTESPDVQVSETLFVPHV